MLRLILGVSGIGLILFGVFGEKQLSDVYNRVAGHAGSPVTVEVPAVAESTAKAPVVEPTAGSVETVTASAQLSSELNSDLNSEADSQAIGDVQIQQPVVSAAEPVVPVSSQTESDMVAVGDEVIATAVDQAPAITLSTTAANQPASDQQLASARNDQVELAKTILNSTEQALPVDGVEVKVTEVDNLLASTAGQADNEVLVVTKDRVNLREGPSIDHPVVLQLQNGQELMEFKREGKWVHVGAYGTSGKIGWVHERLVGNSN